MLPRLAANAVVVFHLGFILFAVFGAWLALWRPRLAWLHLPALGWAVWIELSHRICPLTPLENALRRSAGEAGYGGGFIDHYLIPLIYPPGLQPQDQLWLAALLVVMNAGLYGTLLLRLRRQLVEKS